MPPVCSVESEDKALETAVTLCGSVFMNFAGYTKSSERKSCILISLKHPHS